MSLDRRGRIRYLGPAPESDRVVRIVEALRTADRQTNPAVGRPLGGLGSLRFAWPGDQPPFRISDHDLTLVRYWTLGCPFCLASLPALVDLAKRRAADGLAFLPVYYTRGEGRPTLATLSARLAGFGWTGGFASDPGWTKLREIRDRARLPKATSLSVLVDRQGIVRWVHAGPRTPSSDAPSFVQNDADMRGLEAVVDALLARAKKPPKPAPEIEEEHEGHDGNRVPGR
ncbi:MAG: TlpA family protein disulfide reductase [Planctomycetota bacterium]